MSVRVAPSGMSQQRVWLNAEAPLNMASNVVTLETTRKPIYVCVCVCVLRLVGGENQRIKNTKKRCARDIRWRDEREGKDLSHFFLSINGSNSKSLLVHDDVSWLKEVAP